MRDKRIKPNTNYIIKRCSYCNGIFYAKRTTAKFCSDTHRIYSHKEKNRSANYFGEDPNEGAWLPPGTIPSNDMPESKLVFTGDLASLLVEISEYLTKEELDRKLESILGLPPYSETKSWEDSSEQIINNEYYLEVFRILIADYKLYVWPEEDNNSNSSGEVVDVKDNIIKELTAQVEKSKNVVENLENENQNRKKLLNAHEKLTEQRKRMDGWMN